jgi:hypothetical protein
VTARRVAAALLGLYLALVALGVVLAVASGSGDAEGPVFLAVFSIFMVVGVLVVAQRPGNAIGRVFCAVGLLLATGFVAEGWATYAVLVSPGALPGATLAAWWFNWYWYPLVVLALVVPLLLFPTGGLPSRRWRPVLWILTAATGTFTLLAALRPRLGVTQAASTVTIDNPIGIAALGDPEEGPGSWLFLVILACGLAAVASLLVRFRRARGIERQQLKWFAYAAVVLAVVLPLNDLTGFGDLGIWNVLTSVSFALLPAAIGVAILRHRLYDIDRLINRTVVYGLVTAILVGGYALAALGLGTLAGRDSNLVVAAATLAVATAFGPLRRRVQALVDRRFNRARYDAGQAVAAFSSRLRSQVDLDQLSAELLAVVDRTVQPSAAGLWLREPRPGVNSSRP